MNCYLQSIAHYVPPHMRTNAELVELNPEWNDDVIFRKTGIRARPVATPGVTALDLGLAAAEALFRRDGIDRTTVDVLIFVTESPDYVLPPTACILQHRLGLPTRVASFDVNLGCSGFVYGLSLARSMVLSATAERVLLICAETYSRYCDPHDLTTVTLFGDGAAAALISSDENGSLAQVGESVLGTDGSGYRDLIVEHGGARDFDVAGSKGQGGDNRQRRLSMNGANVFRFALDRIRPACDELLGRLRCTWSDVDVCLCHQANRFMLDALRNELGISAEKLPIDVENIGNLSTASLPVFISRWVESGASKAVQTSLAIGFGVGFSWGVVWLDWRLRARSV